MYAYRLDDPVRRLPVHQGPHDIDLVLDIRLTLQHTLVRQQVPRPHAAEPRNPREKGHEGDHKELRAFPKAQMDNGLLVEAKHNGAGGGRGAGVLRRV